MHKLAERNQTPMVHVKDVVLELEIIDAIGFLIIQYLINDPLRRMGPISASEDIVTPFTTIGATTTAH